MNESASRADRRPSSTVLPLDAGTYVEQSPTGYRVVYVDFGGRVKDVAEYPTGGVTKTGYFRVGPLVYTLPKGSSDA